MATNTKTVAVRPRMSVQQFQGIESLMDPSMKPVKVTGKGDEVKKNRACVATQLGGISNNAAVATVRAGTDLQAVLTKAEKNRFLNDARKKLEEAKKRELDTQEQKELYDLVKRGVEQYNKTMKAYQSLIALAEKKAEQSADGMDKFIQDAFAYVPSLHVTVDGQKTPPRVNTKSCFQSIKEMKEDAVRMLNNSKKQFEK